MSTTTTSTAELVRSHVEAATQGEPFSSVDLLTLGTRAAVDSSLSRLAREGLITRLTRGLYVRPSYNKYVGTVTPEPLKIVQAIARASGSKVGINGAEAARGFSLSTQMSTQTLFLTTGRTRVINIGNSKIRMKHTCENKLALAGRPAGTALAALYYLGKEEVTTAVLGEIKKKLAPAEFEKLCTSTKTMPSWLSDVIYRFIQQSKVGAQVA